MRSWETTERIFSKKTAGSFMDGYVQTRINGGLLLKERKDGLRFGTDALLLASFAHGHLGKGPCADFGTGTGVLPLLLLSAGCRNRFDAYEIQETYVRLAEENASSNGFSDRMRVVEGDLRGYRTLLPREGYSAVLCNPPYFGSGNGKKNRAEEKQIARHADTWTVGQFADAAGWALRPGGKLFCVFLPSRLSPLLSALRSASVEPKRLRLVTPSVSERPSLVLLEAKKDAAEGLIVEPAFPLYGGRDRAKPSEEMEGVYRLFGSRGDGARQTM